MTDFPGDSIKEITILARRRLGRLFWRCHPQAIIVLANLRAVEVSDIGKETPTRKSRSFEKLLARKIVLKDNGKQSFNTE
jgi:hypothetical protein